MTTFAVCVCVTAYDLEKSFSFNKIVETRNRKHRRAAAKSAACAKPLMLSTVRSKEKREGA